MRFAAWRVAYGHLVPAEFFESFDVDAPVARWRRGIVEGTRHAFVAERGGTVVGFCAYGRCRDDDLPGADEVYAIYVHPGHWSTGAGRALMSAALGALGRPVVLWVLRDNPRARRFYERAGFRPDGAERDITLGGTPLPEVRYRLD